MKSKSKSVVMYATLAALIVVSLYLDRLLTIYLPVSAAFITLTVTFTFGLVKDNFALSIASGTIFGAASCLLSLLTGNEAFINPLISILPRFCLGFILFGVYRLMRKILHKLPSKKREAIAAGTASAITAASNTALVISALALFGNIYYTGDALKVMLLVNALPELILSAVLVPIIVMSLRKALRISVDYVNPAKAQSDTAEE